MNRRRIARAHCGRASVGCGGWRRSDAWLLRCLGQAIAAGTVALVLVGPAERAVAQPVFADPLENVNRPVHAFNKGADQFALRPITYGYRAVLPPGVRTGINNVLEHLSLPADILNHILQANLEAAAKSAMRFALNTVIGIGGIHDIATAEGLPRMKTDFGLTLAAYRVGEGMYLSAPLIGPTTARDLAGRMVDRMLSPASLADLDTGASAGFFSLYAVSVRDQNFATLDEVLYARADSYPVVRDAYLQNRRFRAAGNNTDITALPDLYEFEDDEDFE